MSLRGRLTLMSAVIVGVILAIGAVVCFVVMRHQLRSQIDDQLKGQARLVRQFAPRPNEAPLRLPRLPRQRPQGSAPYGQLIRPDGSVQHVAGVGALPVSAADVAVARGRRSQRLADIRIGGNHVRTITVSAGKRGAVQLGRPLDSVDGALSSLRLVLAALVAGGLALAALASRGFSRPVLAPIGDLTDATAHIEATGDLGRRVNADRGDEVGQLASSFNAMLARLEAAQAALSDSMAAQRQLIADASHELRTPVTGLRTNIEVLLANDSLDTAAREALMADVVDQTDELTGVVGDVIELARGDQPVHDQGDVDLAAIIQEALVRARRHAPQLNYMSDVEPWPMVGSAERLGRAMNNMLDNAAKFAPAGSTVEVHLHDGEVTIRDRGPGVPEQDLPHIFDRFFRVSNSSSRQGSGLGLAIVKQVVESHGGRVGARTADGGGLVVSILFAPERSHDSPRSLTGSASPTAGRRLLRTS